MKKNKKKKVACESPGISPFSVLCRGKRSFHFASPA
jgi:hypothetical protein